MSAFAPVGKMFAPLAPIFDGLGEKLRGVWQWFKDLIAPVKATQDTLNSCRDVGVMFGQALADALLMPLNAFNKLRSGIDWVLEKLGIINKESSSLDQTAAKANAATQNGYSPAISSYNSYQPVTAPAGRSYIDQSRSEYHFTLQGGIAPNGQLDNQLRDAVERLEREARQITRQHDARLRRPIMMLALGMFVFMRQTLPYQSMQRSADYSWASNSRIGKRDAFQYLGEGEDKITLSGDLYPELTGGKFSMLALYAMAEQGRAWPLISGSGWIYGMFVVSNVSETGTVFFEDGSPRKISFTLSLTRVDESLAAVYGDIGKQAESLVGKAGDLLSQVGCNDAGYYHRRGCHTDARLYADTGKQRYHRQYQRSAD